MLERTLAVNSTLQSTQGAKFLREGIHFGRKEWPSANDWEKVIPVACIFSRPMHSLWPKVESFYPQLWRAVGGYELNLDVRQELLQDVLLAIWKSLPRLREPDLLLAFILRIAHNPGASHVRSSIRRPDRVPLDESLHDIADQAALGINDRSHARWLFETLAMLPLNLRQPLMLQLERFDYQEIADVLGISAENVGVRLHRARERLKVLSRQEDAR